MATPIWDELSDNIKRVTESAYQRGRIEERLALADRLRAVSKKPPVWVVKLIKELESGN